jgi:hypothetical protein
MNKEQVRKIIVAKQSQQILFEYENFVSYNLFFILNDQYSHKCYSTSNSIKKIRQVLSIYL